MFLHCSNSHSLSPTIPLTNMRNWHSELYYIDSPVLLRFTIPKIYYFIPVLLSSINIGSNLSLRCWPIVIDLTPLSAGLVAGDNYSTETCLQRCTPTWRISMCLQNRITSEKDRFLTLKDRLGEEKTESENLAGVCQDLQSEATQRTTGKKTESYKKSVKVIEDRTTRAWAENDAE